jgi:hypothetical protein
MLPKITVAGRVGVVLLTFSAGKLDLWPALLYGLSVLGVMLILWEAVTYAAQLARHIRSKAHRAPATLPRPSLQRLKED